MATEVTGLRYEIDRRSSQFTVQAFASGLIAVVAHSPKIAIRDWTCVVQMRNDDPNGASMKATVNVATLEVLDELRDDDRREIHRVMNQEVLETARYPTISFESTQIKAEKLKDDLYRLHVTGMLDLHGVKNEQSFVTQVAFGVDSARAYGEFILRQSDYNIRIASVARGTLKLQDELKFSFYVVARKAA